MHPQKLPALLSFIFYKEQVISGFFVSMYFQDKKKQKISAILFA